MSIEEQVRNGGPVSENIEQGIPAEAAPVESTPSFPLLEWLKKPTGEGSIESRVEHPLNFKKSIAIARVIRGLEGLMGALNLAIVDIVLGILEYAKEKKQEAAASAE